MLSGFGSTAGGFGLSFSEGFFGGGETGPEASPNKHLIFSVLDAPSLDGDFFQRRHPEALSPHGDVSTFVMVRYAGQERRTKTARLSLSPRWESSFIFEYDPDAEHVLFLFFVEDAATERSELFGQVVVPLKSAHHPLPSGNRPYLLEAVPICAAASADLSRLRLASSPSEELLSAFRSSGPPSSDERDRMYDDCNEGMSRGDDLR